MKWHIRITVLLCSLVIMTGCKQAKKDEVVQDAYQDNVQTELSVEPPVVIEPEVEEVVEVLEEKPVLPTPISGLYPEMVVEKQEYVPLAEGEKNVYITFDDGPCKTTPDLLKVLKELDVKATFFVTGQYGTDEEVVEWMKMIKADGHEIGVHSYSHRYNEIYSSVKKYLEDFKKMDDLIVEATGEHSKIFRFPGGSNTGYNTKIREKVIREMTSRGMVYYDWNAYNGDCDGFSKKEMVAKAVKESGYRDKSIVLMHNIPNKDQVIETLPKIVNQLKKEGYACKALEGTVEPIQFIKEADVVNADLKTNEKSKM